MRSDLLDRIVCADWSGSPLKRAVWEAVVAERVIRQVAGEQWTAESVIAHATGVDRVLVAFDAPIGLPASYFAAARKLPVWSRATTFLDWLRAAPASAFDATE